MVPIITTVTHIFQTRQTTGTVGDAFSLSSLILSSIPSTLGSEQSEPSYDDLFQELNSVRMSCPKNIMISHININSVRNKFHELSDLFIRSLVDILFISETKLDQSFRQAPFEVTGYKSYRKDRSSHGGGILAYVRADLKA